ncbi:MAG: tail fiber domain-containing protein [Trueperaceae bacterium]|nr:tail fiber domain-containing protein [Trueperaceae bacterium]
MKRGIAYGTVSIALALAGAWVAAQLDLRVFEAGEIISSEAVNHNFQELGAAVAERQLRVDGTCDPGSAIRAIAADGSVSCETDDTGGAGGSGGDPTVTTDATLTGDGSEGAPLGLEVPLQIDGFSNANPILRAANESTGSAVLGEHVDGTRGYLGFEAYAVYGQHSSGNMGRLGSDDYGVFGMNDAFESHGYFGSEDTGAYGQNHFQSGRGVYGYAGHTSGTNHGVIGASESTSGTGVHGRAIASSGETYGTAGTAASPDGYALWGENEATGSFGYVGGDWAVYGSHGDGDAAGVLGTENAGVLGMGFRGALAGRFDGDVEVDGDLSVSGTINPPSSRTMKEDVRPVDGVDVLRTLATIPVTSWRYTADDARALHVGPMAEDFHEAFGLGADRARISTIDADGVALAAIQGLYRELQQRDRRIAQLESRLAALEAEGR